MRGYETWISRTITGQVMFTSGRAAAPALGRSRRSPGPRARGRPRSPRRHRSRPPAGPGDDLGRHLERELAEQHGRGIATLKAKWANSSSVCVVAMMAPRVQAFRHEPQSMHRSACTLALSCLTRMAQVGQARMQARQPSQASSFMRKPWAYSITVRRRG